VVERLRSLDGIEHIEAGTLTGALGNDAIVVGVGDALHQIADALGLLADSTAERQHLLAQIFHAAKGALKLGEVPVFRVEAHLLGTVAHLAGGQRLVGAGDARRTIRRARGRTAQPR
jgi:hypothetical protein